MNDFPTATTGGATSAPAPRKGKYWSPTAVSGGREDPPDSRSAGDAQAGGRGSAGGWRMIGNISIARKK